MSDMKRKDTVGGQSLDRIALECSAKLPGIRERYEDALNDAISSYNLTHKNFLKCESDLLHVQQECETNFNATQLVLNQTQDKNSLLEEANQQLRAAIDVSRESVT